MLDTSLLLNYINLPQLAALFLLVLALQLILISNRGARYMGMLIPTYKAPQKIHEGSVSRLGGLCMLLGIVSLSALSENEGIRDHITLFLFAFSPLAALTLLEDLHNPMSPKVRLATMLGVSWLILSWTGISLPVLDTPYLGDILAEPTMRSLFYAVCLTALMNGVNFVDGTNGNFALMTITMMISLAFFGTTVGDMEFVAMVLLCTIPLVAFTTINFPWGRIFAGDLGAYMYGGLVGFFILVFFGRHTDISAWNAVLITFYPIAELVYSIIRKVLNRQSPFQPDRGHLHIKIFTILHRGCKKPRLANNMVTLFLGIFWLVPSVILPWVYQSHTLIAIVLAFLTICFITVNRAIPRFD